MINLTFDLFYGIYLMRFEQVQVTCLMVKSDGLMFFLWGGESMSSCHSRGERIPASRRTSRQSFTSADMFPRAHSDCSRTPSSLLFAIKSTSRGRAPNSAIEILNKQQTVTEDQEY